MMFKNLLQFLFLLTFSSATLNAQSPNWHIVYHTNNGFQFSASNFSNADIGWIGGKAWDSNPPNAIKSIILKTTNAGLTWQPQVFDSLTNSARNIYEISFLDSLTGIITASHKIYYTFDGGKNWNNQTLNDSLIYRSCYLLNDSTWIVSGWQRWSPWPEGGEYGFAYEVLKTDDYGKTWNMINTPHPIESIHFFDDSSGIAFFDGNVLYTKDYGENWEILSLIQGLSVISAQVIGNQIIALTDDNKLHNIIIKSYDRGKNWKTIYTFSFEPAWCMCFADTLYGRIGSSAGEIYVTYDGGFNWTKEQTPINGLIISILQSNGLWFAGSYDGHILKYSTPTLVEKNGNKLDSNLKIEIYPNPSNSNFIILASTNKIKSFTVSIYNSLGQKIKTLTKNNEDSGKFNLVWDGTNQYDKLVGSGLYFVVFKTFDTIVTKRLLLLR